MLPGPYMGQGVKVESQYAVCAEVDDSRVAASAAREKAERPQLTKAAIQGRYLSMMPRNDVAAPGRAVCMSMAYEARKESGASAVQAGIPVRG
jgi:hypothetical protein